MTPKYRDQMIGIISKEMNRVYGLYTQRNPGFLGKVTIVGHSLGVSSRQTRLDSKLICLL
jgi:hypothetical protein